MYGLEIYSLFDYGQNSSPRCAFISVQTSGQRVVHILANSQFVMLWEVGIYILFLCMYGLEVHELSDYV